MAHVADDADYGDPFHVRLARITKADPFADRVLVRKPFLREGIVDDRDARAIELIAIVEESALQKWNFKDREIFRRDVANLFVGKNFLDHRVAAFDREGAVAVRPAQRQNAGEGRPFHSR